jgi:hypothetical protein
MGVNYNLSHPWSQVLQAWRQWLLFTSLFYFLVEQQTTVADELTAHTILYGSHSGMSLNLGKSWEWIEINVIFVLSMPVSAL